MTAEIGRIAYDLMQCAYVSACAGSLHPTHIPISNSPLSYCIPVVTFLTSAVGAVRGDQIPAVAAATVCNQRSDSIV
jgi:hypothetical protein